MDHLHLERALQQAAERLGQWLEQAGDHVGAVPTEVWRRVATLAAEVAAHADTLAKGGDRDRPLRDGKNGL